LGDKVDRALYERYRTLVHAASLDALRRNDPSPGERRRLLDSVVESSPDFAWIGFADATGRVLTATGGLLENTDAAQRPWFRGAREQPFLGPIRDNPELARTLPASLESESNTRFMELAVPVQAADGRFAGVLAAQVRWGWSRDVQLSVVPEAVAREQVAATVYGAEGDILLDSGALGWSHPPAAPVVGETRRARGWIVETTPEGARFLTGFSRSRGFREYRGLGWIAVVRQPLRLVFAPGCHAATIARPLGLRDRRRWSRCRVGARRPTHPTPPLDHRPHPNVSAKGISWRCCPIRRTTAKYPGCVVPSVAWWRICGDPRSQGGKTLERSEHFPCASAEPFHWYGAASPVSVQMHGGYRDLSPTGKMSG
jgi:hypothetical protein